MSGERVEFDFVNDDGSLAPAAGDFTAGSVVQRVRAMSGQGGVKYGEHAKPRLNILGSRLSRLALFLLLKPRNILPFC